MQPRVKSTSFNFSFNNGTFCKFCQLPVHRETFLNFSQYSVLPGDLASKFGNFLSGWENFCLLPSTFLVAR